MPYEVLQPTAIHRTVDEIKDVNGNVIGWDDAVGMVYPVGFVIADEDVSEYIKKQYDDGDAHVLSLLKKTGDEPTQLPGTEIAPENGPDSGAPGVLRPDGNAEPIVAEDAEAEPKAAPRRKE